jgi:hypothetical protein
MAKVDVDIKIRFIKPDRMYRAGDVLTLHPSSAMLYLKRGVAVKVKEARPKKNKTIKKGRVKTKAVSDGE